MKIQTFLYALFLTFIISLNFVNAETAAKTTCSSEKTKIQKLKKQVQGLNATVAKLLGLVRVLDKEINALKAQRKINRLKTKSTLISFRNNALKAQRKINRKLWATIKQQQTYITALQNGIRRLQNPTAPACYVESSWGGMKWTPGCKKGYHHVGGLSSAAIAPKMYGVAHPRWNKWHNAHYVWWCCRNSY